MLVSGSSRSLAVLPQSASRNGAQDAPQAVQERRSGTDLPTVSITSGYGSKLADALWSMGNTGVVLEQEPSQAFSSEESKLDAGGEFLKVSNMSPAERIRYFYLKDRELNEDKLAAMNEKDRELVEQQIKELILQQLGLENEDGKPGDAPEPAPEGPPIPIDPD